MKTHAATGDLDPSTAPKSLLKGTNLTIDFVNDRTLAVTARPKCMRAPLMSFHGLFDFFLMCRTISAARGLPVQVASHPKANVQM
jgi:hypothetical protein